ncbi:Ig-like domain-containing protein [Actinomadura viridis]|uniref:Lipoprotein-anchoring transpeptidase ErfK/SrfK n=1 Tax=Actinomadura viridis TaxID=58110 RepID=A0A931DLA1_9ACTN|nr:Ig-like domain-containing protein [Actinomadura viridis]MBG6090132.1 lipoprotein-anchoring transpeptidase ErfK/SrfK [Actinomadura viridis]
MLKGRPVTASTAMTCAVVVLAAGCSSGGGKGGGPGGGDGPAGTVAISPANGAREVAPDQPVTVKAEKGGRLTAVTVADARGREAEGRLAGDGLSWRTTWGLRPATTYTVTARGTAGGKPLTSSSTFTTLAPARKLESGMAPLEGERVGVGMPIQLLLTRPVTTRQGKAAVERALEVRMSKPVEGAWHWISDKELDFRPRDYWPVGQKVQVVAHLAGVRAGEGLWGVKDRVLNFTVGPRHVTTIDAGSYRATVTDGGRTVRTMKVSLGKPGDDSYTGVMIAQEKRAAMVMDSATTGNPGEYRTPTKWNVRMTYSGTFIHSAPWSAGSQGNANVSHGCVNASPSDAKWFYDFTNRGDIIEVKGTTRKLRFGNGPTPWAKSWEDWVKGSALGKPVQGVTLG